MFRSASLFIGTSFTVPVSTIFATSDVDSIVGIPHKIYSMQRIFIHIKKPISLLNVPICPRACSEPGSQKPVLSLSLDRIQLLISNIIWFDGYLCKQQIRSTSSKSYFIHLNIIEYTERNLVYISKQFSNAKGSLNGCHHLLCNKRQRCTLKWSTMQM